MTTTRTRSTIKIEEMEFPLPVFVYGTLRKGHGNYRHFFADNDGEILNVTTKGRLYHVMPGRTAIYPVAVFGGEDEIKGDIIWFNELTEPLYYAHRMELGAGYHASLIQVETPDEGTLVALAWEFPESQLRRVGSLIEGGDWNAVSQPHF